MRCLALAALTAALLALAPQASQADGFSFSVSKGYSHGHRHHHHHHGWGPSFGISLWSPPPPRYVYVAPPPVVERVYVQPPVVQERVIIEQPRTSSYDSAASTTSTARLPAPPARAETGSPVVIRNTNGRGLNVAFLLDDRNEELRDGQTRTFAGSSHVVEFDRGGTLGTARYELTGGLYGFVVGENGWELVRDSSAPRTAERPTLKANELPSILKR